MAEQIRIPVIFEEDTSGLARTAGEIEKVTKATKEFQDTKDKAFSGNAEGINELTEGLQDAGAEMADFSNTTKQAGQSGNVFKSVVRENVRGLTLFGHNLGEVVDGLKAKQVALRGVMAGLGGTSSALKVLKVALISTGIGAIVVLLGSLIAFFAKTQAGTNKVSQGMAALGAVVDVLFNTLIQVGIGAKEAFDKFKDGNPTLFKVAGAIGTVIGKVLELTSGIGLLMKIFPGVTSEMKSAAIAAIQLEAATQRLSDAERKLSIDASAKRAEIEKNKEIADDETKSFNKRIIAAKAASLSEQELKKEEIKLAEEAVRIIKDQNKQRKLLLDDSDEDREAQAVIKLNELKADGSKQERLDLNKTQSLLRQQQREVQKLADEERKRNEQRLKIEAANRQAFSDLQKNIAQQINDEEQLAATEQERLQFQKQNAIESLKIAEEELVARAKSLGQQEEIAKIQTDFARLRAITIERYEKEITKIVQEQVDEQISALEELDDSERARIEGVRSSRLKFITDQQQLDEMRIDAIKKSGNDELSLEQFKEDAKLRLLIDSLERQRLAILETDTSGQGVELFDIKKIDAEIDQIKDKLEEIETLTIFDRIKARILDSFKLSPDEGKIISEQIGQAIGNIFDGLSSLNDAAISQQNQVVDEKRKQVDELRGLLDEELQLKKDGYANNSDLLAEQLATQTELLRIEEEKRLALEKKASKLRLRQNALELASNIALSIAKAIDANAKFGLVGIVTAAAQIAAIFALIAKGKAQAAAFSKPELRKGARLKGQSHERGGTPIIMNGEHAYTAEKGEWLIGTQPSAEHDGFLERLNNNEFSGDNLNKQIDFSRAFFDDPSAMIAGLAPKYGIPLMPDIVGEILPTIRKSVLAGQIAKQEYEKALMVDVMSRHFGQMEGGLTRIERAIEGIPQLVPITEAGYIEKRKRGNTTSIAIFDPPKRRNKA